MARSIHWLYAARYNYGAGLPLRAIHGFVLDKPKRIYERLCEAHQLAEARFEGPDAPVSREALLAVHTERLVDDLASQAAVAAAVELAPLRWLPAMVVRRAVVAPQLWACAGTAQAMRWALAGDWVFNLSGGYHHARPDLSHGFCLVNDVAVAVAALRAEGAAPRIVVLDLDLHQGDGNSVAFADDDDVFTASLHEGGVFPHPKMISDLDVELHRATADEEYLAAVDAIFTEIDARFPDPDIVVYVAGTDPYFADPLGTLDVSRDGMIERDRRVAAWVERLGAGLVALPAGGYTPVSPELSADGFDAMAAVVR